MKDKSLVIVESPAKIKTLQKFLGPKFIFASSVGHIRDLPEKSFGIDIEHDFAPDYELMKDKKEVIAKLKKAAKECQEIFLAPDPDREGEAIAWHIQSILPKNQKVYRITFNAITKDAVKKALASPREIDMALVNSQQARRILDRLVGYTISPILNRRIHRGKNQFVSAGRVQSVAVKLVVDREKEIMAFKPVEYWTLTLHFSKIGEDKTFAARLFSVNGKKVAKEAEPGKELFLIPNAEVANSLFEEAKKGPYKLLSLDKKEKRRNPPAPFITSTLQQEASRHHGFSSQRTMSIAQGLYEGIDLGDEGAEGLITYMRTDSVRVAPEAQEEAKRYILNRFGKEYLPETLRQYSTKEGAQDAHEAIRPTRIDLDPDSVRKHLTEEQYRLYSLIYRRFLASQMASAIYDTAVADIENTTGLLFRATGSIIKFSGFLALYEEKIDDKGDEDDENKTLPPLAVGEKLEAQNFNKEQSFTRPPPRFTEASLVKELEKSGIGRPSTYAAIMNKIQSRDYTNKEQGRLKPTELGFVIADLLESNFGLIMNIGFTKEMEDSLELIAENKKEWVSLLKEFWKEFSPLVETAKTEAFVPKIPTDKLCPKCTAPLQKVWSKSKYFYGCTRYPDCDFSAPLEELEFDKSLYAEDFNWQTPCPKCGKEMKLRFGRFGPFLGCLSYPECRGIVNIPKKGETIISQADLPACVAIGCTGHMVAKKSRFGKIFYSCSTFPECDIIVNDIEELAIKYPDHPKTAYVAKPKGRGRKSAAPKKEAATPKKRKASPKKGKAKPKKTEE